MKPFLDRLQRLAAGFGHVYCEYDDCHERKRPEEEVRTGRGAGEKYRCGECDQPIHQLEKGNNLSVSPTSGRLLQIRITHEIHPLSYAVSRSSRVLWLNLGRVDLPNDPPG